MANAAKHALICGGTRGIGLTVARTFLERGFNVSVLSRFDSNVRRAVDHLQAANVAKLRVNSYICDVSNERNVFDCFKEIEEQNKTIDVLVNCAAINVDSLLVKCAHSDIKNAIDTNLIGTMLTSKQCVKLMIRQRKGSIVNLGTTSIVALKGNIGQTVYSATKAGVIGFSKSLAKEVASKNITVNVVSPGIVETEMTESISKAGLLNLIPLKRFATSYEIAECVYFIANANFITGEVFIVDGGMSLQF
ncbi:carbonyl reductase family member 4-like protein [Dinothrombium tinctorium]|uniref:3-ketoacyl-[acyl-carrier-protein] reductase beta subunit n=1 Tax=Dinothrombium tinctorium TaxID=1965070 RepID=A0A3S3PSE4_9ACAR|nr:carbonyl reductase family member 4-like protein [Dinothrombium tinctorium]RWS07348.1 carbonyl reductase family member 4-like protein [Dinothrombium tinctorium]RWS07357.1 carbonyl reductase family member 4-like protein [Dinothrombium tinctorium]RWS09703.1 carbonyl reductase family member 4-like protein [Dinothrombium tinctorium]